MFTLRVPDDAAPWREPVVEPTKKCRQKHKRPSLLNIYFARAACPWRSSAKCHAPNPITLVAERFAAATFQWGLERLEAQPSKSGQPTAVHRCGASAHG
jgi:hypothetical protein